VVTETLVHLDPEGAVSALPVRPSTPFALTPSHRGTGMDLVAGNESLLDSLIGKEELAAEITPEGRPPIWGLPRVLVSKPTGSPPRPTRPLVPLGPMPFHLCSNFDLVAGDESLLDSRIGEITTGGRAPPGGPPRGFVSRPAGSPPASTLGCI